MRYRQFTYGYRQYLGEVREEEPRPRGVLARMKWRPEFDAFATEEDFVVRADLAGVSEADCEIALYDDYLVIEGERSWPFAQAEGTRFYTAEIRYGRFGLAIPVPFPIDRERVLARLERGILTLTLGRARVPS